jgi:predicted RNase H-like nuclease (RuvC/YqgF family)
MWARGVSFLSASLLLMTMLLFQGCATDILGKKIDSAEKNLSHGKASEENLKALEPVFPPSLVARHKIALIMDSIVKGEYAFGIMKTDLEEIRGQTLLPGYLKVEAGYLLELLERMETFQKSAAKAKEYAKESEELKRSLEQAKKEIETLKKENEDIKKEIELLSYKLNKLEQIHIESVKRRGKQ